ncbi:uncharacterized protein LOC115876382 [Sitophilus oryzae]|uniref:Uncharacterized protein LOC115876382 n=1 Tax=Sitophilus oryzae TaxID=7048 RepID=A0A6J2X9R5_SITOR|nr:uncharacterized protein LOC115876382 [Sitophilus oryzae]
MGDETIKWAINEDDSVVYAPLTKQLLPQAIELMHGYFYTQETICKAFHVANQPECFPELDILLRKAAVDGVSIVALDKTSGAVIGATFNKLEEKTDSDFYQEYPKTLKYPASRKVAMWIADTEKLFDIFDHCNVSSLFEIMFLGVVPSFRNRGIAKKLIQVSIDIARQLKAGNNVLVPVNDQDLNLEHPPQIVTGIFTSSATQKIAKDLNFEIGSKIYFDKYVYDGQSLGDLVGQEIPYFTYEYLRL